MEYTRNSDPDYYNKHLSTSNCGSYALRLQEWYDPEPYFEMSEGDLYEWVEEMTMSGYSDAEISTLYTHILVEGMLEEFEGELELCDGRAPSTLDKELIAMNSFCIFDEDYSSDIDFHFKVFRDGIWSEKCGSEEVRFCEEDEWGRYIGDPVYMYHYIGENQ